MVSIRATWVACGVGKSAQCLAQLLAAWIWWLVGRRCPAQPSSDQRSASDRVGRNATNSPSSTGVAGSGGVTGAAVLAVFGARRVRVFFSVVFSVVMVS